MTITETAPFGIGAKSFAPIRERPPATSASAIERPSVEQPYDEVTWPSAGVPVGADNVWVIFSAPEQNGLSQAAVKNGKFIRWRLAPGKYTLHVSGRGGDARDYISTSQEIEIGKENIENLAFDLVPEFDLTGLIQWEGTPPTPDPQKSLSVHLSSRDRYGFRPGVQLTGVIGADQAFRIPRVTVGAYDVVLNNAPDSAWVKSIQVDSHDTPDRWLDLRAPPQSVTLLLATATGEISGVVEDDHGPVADLTVFLRLMGSQSPKPRLQQTGADGKYSFHGVPPGKYTVTCGQTSETIELSEGDKVTRNLKLEKP